AKSLRPPLPHRAGIGNEPIAVWPQWKVACDRAADKSAIIDPNGCWEAFFAYFAFFARLAACSARQWALRGRSPRPLCANTKCVMLGSLREKSDISEKKLKHFVQTSVRSVGRRFARSRNKQASIPATTPKPD